MSSSSCSPYLNHIIARINIRVGRVLKLFYKKAVIIVTLNVRQAKFAQKYWESGNFLLAGMGVISSLDDYEIYRRDGAGHDIINKSK